MEAERHRPRTCVFPESRPFPSWAIIFVLFITLQHHRTIHLVRPWPSTHNILLLLSIEGPWILRLPPHMPARSEKSPT